MSEDAGRAITREQAQRLLDVIFAPGRTIEERGPLLGSVGRMRALIKDLPDNALIAFLDPENDDWRLYAWNGSSDFYAATGCLILAPGEHLHRDGRRFDKLP